MRYRPPESLNCTMKTASELLPPDLSDKMLEPTHTTTSKPLWLRRESIKDIDSFIAEVAE